MILHILRKDLKRKRTMNVILFLFILLAATFLAASVSNLVTLTGALDYFMEIAKAPDSVMVAVSEMQTTPVEEFLAECPAVSDYEVQDTYALTGEAISIAYCAQDPQKHKYEKKDTVVLSPVPENFAKVFDSDDRPLTLRAGEIALPRTQADENGLQTGDRLEISVEGYRAEYTVAAIVKDAIFGSEMIGMKRLFLSGDDYEELMSGREEFHTMLYFVNYSDKEEYRRAFSEQNFEIISTLEKPVIRMCYFFDILMAGIIVIVGVCLILISFLLLRFTIVFTLQEDYKEIGIMKAIGIGEWKIKSIYLLKYLAVSLIGSAIGFCFSFPFEEMLLKQLRDVFPFPEREQTAWMNLLCAVGIVVVVALFCYGCTGKIRKISVIEAIRNGGSGERYTPGRGLRLYKRRKMPPFWYLAWNDVLRNAGRYAVLAVIFCIGTMEILLPLAAIHTLEDDEIIRTFGMQSCSVLLDKGETETYLVMEEDTLLRDDMEEIKKKLRENGLQAEVWAELDYLIPCCGKDSDKKSGSATYTIQQVGKEEDDYDVLEGSVPILPNEVMVTEKTAEELGVTIGELVHFQFPEGEKEFIVTGIYQSMINMGYGLRVSKTAKLPYRYLSGIFGLFIKVDNGMEAEELRAQIADIFPDYEIRSGKEWIDRMIGVMDQLDLLQGFITLVVLCVNVLITVLMVKTLITREQGEIAMLKSIGFGDRSIRAWQSSRILAVLSVSILAGTVLSALLCPVTIGLVFSMMGATSIRLHVNPLEAYVLYPLLLLGVTGIAAYWCAGGVKRIAWKEINMLE